MAGVICPTCLYFDGEHAPFCLRRLTMPMPPPVDNKCLTCESRKAAQCKGLCMRCYSSAKKQVEAKKVTWEKLAELGMIESEKTPFEIELERRLKGTLPEGP